jgi:DNA-binding NarL/FixJ family response regulator
LYTPEPVLAKGLASLLASTVGFKLVAICQHTESLAPVIAAKKPDIALLDLTPEVTLPVLQDIRKRNPNCRLMLWVAEISTETAYQAISAGIRGIIRRSLPLNMILDALGKVAKGELIFDKALTDSILEARKVPLTKREGQLMNMLSQGLKNKEMAMLLCVSENTIKVYLSRLFQKVGVKDRFELALYGLRNVAGAQCRFDDSPDSAHDQETSAASVPRPA